MFLELYDSTRCVIPSYAVALHYHRLERQRLKAGRPPGSVTGGWRRRLRVLTARLARQPSNPPQELPPLR